MSSTQNIAPLRDLIQNHIQCCRTLKWRRLNVYHLYIALLKHCFIFVHSVLVVQWFGQYKLPSCCDISIWNRNKKLHKLNIVKRENVILLFKFQVGSGIQHIFQRTSNMEKHFCAIHRIIKMNNIWCARNQTVAQHWMLLWNKIANKEHCIAASGKRKRTIRLFAFCTRWKYLKFYYVSTTYTRTHANVIIWIVVRGMMGLNVLMVYNYNNRNHMPY